jgi:hypothetical protein
VPVASTKNSLALVNPLPSQYRPVLTRRIEISTRWSPDVASAPLVPQKPLVPQPAFQVVLPYAVAAGKVTAGAGGAAESAVIVKVVVAVFAALSATVSVLLPVSVPVVAGQV